VSFIKEEDESGKQVVRGVRIVDHETGWLFGCLVVVDTIRRHLHRPCFDAHSLFLFLNLSGATSEVRGKCVINATGPFSGFDIIRYRTSSYLIRRADEAG
jgi:glycerol-3-phosphate dehydrogenase